MGSPKKSKDTSVFQSLAVLRQAIEHQEETCRVKFVVLNKDKAFGNDFDFADKTSFRLRWEYDDSSLHPCRIPFTGVPFIAVGRKTLECHQGKDRNIRQKEKYAIQTDLHRDPESKKKSQILQRTKKVSCPAMIIIIQIARLPEIQVKENKEWTKRMAAADLRKMIQKGHRPRQTAQFYAVFPRDEDHKGHPIRNERWVRCFQNEELYLAVHVAGGAEKMAEALKYPNLEQYKSSTLKDLVLWMITKFFPDSYRAYQEHSGYNQSNAGCPSFLQNRPRHIVQHIQDRIMRSVIPRESISCHGNGVFSSNIPGEMHKLTFGDASHIPCCTCRDWQTHLLPCKHFCSVFRNFPAWQWDSLSPLYRDNPIFTLDEGSHDPCHSAVPRDHHSMAEDMVTPGPNSQASAILEDQEQEQRKQALQECTNTMQDLMTSVSRLKDASQILAIERTLQEVLDSVNGWLSGEDVTMAVDADGDLREESTTIVGLSHSDPSQQPCPTFVRLDSLSIPPQGQVDVALE